MLLLDKTLLKMCKGLWANILAIVAVRFLSLIFVTRFALSVGSYLSALIDPLSAQVSFSQALVSAFLSSLFILAMSILQGELEYRCTAKARRKLRSLIFDKVLSLDAGNIEKIGPTSAITSSLDAVETMQNYYSQYLPSLFLSFLAPLYLFFSLYQKNNIIALIFLCVSLSLLPINNIFRSRIEALRKVYWRSVDDMTAYYLDSVRGLNTLKLFDRSKQHRDVLAVKADKLNKDINDFMKVSFLSNITAETLIYGSLIAALYLLCKDVIADPFMIGNALSLFLVGYSYYSSFKKLSDATHNALTAVSAAFKVEQILAVDTDRPYDPSIRKEEPAYPGIEVEGISFAYEGRKEALKDVSLKIEKGKVSALAGLSGCGKSTLASMMMRFLDPQKGKIRIEGYDYRSMKVEELRKKIIMVPQNVSLFSGTLRENLQIGRQADDTRLMEVLEEVRLSDWLKGLEEGLDYEVGDSGSRLSGGQKQKIGIARALLSESEYIIFDEATSSVDPQSEKEIRECIRRLSQTKTLIIISHRLSAIKDADRIFVLSDGQILASGRHDELMKQDGLYKDLVSDQEALERGLA